MILFVALGIIPTDESNFHAPHWVVGAAGLAFFLAGLAILTGPPAGTPEASKPEASRTTWRSFVLGLGVVGALAAVFNWVAFGPAPGPSAAGSRSRSCRSPARRASGRAGSPSASRRAHRPVLVWVIVRGLRDLLGRDR